MAAKKSGREIPDDVDLHLHWRFFFDPPEFMTTFAIVGADATDYEQLEGRIELESLHYLVIPDHRVGVTFGLLLLVFHLVIFLV